MEPLNFSRQLALQIATTLQNPKASEYIKGAAPHILSMHKQSTKFILPGSGRFMEDEELRAFGDGQTIRLPFPCIALEWVATEDEIQQELERSRGKDVYVPRKHIVYAEEVGDNGDVLMTPAWFLLGDTRWTVAPPLTIAGSMGLSPYLSSAGGRMCSGWTHPIADRFNIPLSDYQHELGVLLGFLNVLACSNVGHESAGQPRKAKKGRDVLPFDEYRVLTIRGSGEGHGRSGGEHRSPREHLRRGHIRRLPSGGRTWVSSCVVAAGAPGKIRKDYFVEAVA